MKIFGIEITRAKKGVPKMQDPPSPPTSLYSPESSYYNRRNRWYPVTTEYFDGEKTPNELGPLKDLRPNHAALRYRVYEAQLKSHVVRSITGKFFKWIIGTGLKLQAEPHQIVLNSEGINVELTDFRANVESRFAIYTGSKKSDYKNMNDLHDLAADAFTTAFLGGDALCIQRVSEEGYLNMQVIDGQHVQTPHLDNDLRKGVEERGNRIVNGVEVNDKGEHISFFVKTVDKENPLGRFERVLARGETTGRLLAFLIYGTKHRIDHVRGVPIITSIIEQIEKFDRYTEAAVGSAEERAKIVFAIEHTKDSDGENPLLAKAKQAAGMGQNAAEETSGYDAGFKTAEQIAATTSKQTFNMPIGSQLKALASTFELNYPTFAKAVFEYLCAAVDIPPEVAMQLYEQNYSSSRAAINAWDYIVKTYRKQFSKHFYKNFYTMWLELEVINNKVVAPGFIKALQDDNHMIIEAYFNCRFVGANMPHIDPLKEVNAIRKMLGNELIPLISNEQATELLGAGDWHKNIEKYAEEEALFPEPIVKPTTAPSDNDNSSSGANNEEDEEREE